MPGERGGVPVTLASNLRLLGEAVAAALEERGFDVVLIPWPQAGHGTSAREEISPHPTVIVCDPLDEQAVEGVDAVLQAHLGPALVVAGRRPDPAWGAVLEAGADAVVSSSTSIRDLVASIEAMARGEPLMGVVERQALLRLWFAERADRRALTAQVAQLTPREREVLDLLHSGETATAIAVRLGVSESTVRSQIRSLLHKLGVRTQLAAVAIEEIARSGSNGGSG